MSRLRWDNVRHRGKPAEQFDHRGFERPHDNEQMFNQIYRERRVAASASGVAFPSYSQARARLAEVARSAYVGDGIDPTQFWSMVFTVGGDSFD
jgi:hypothetical protein